MWPEFLCSSTKVVVTSFICIHLGMFSIHYVVKSTDIYFKNVHSKSSQISEMADRTSQQSNVVNAYLVTHSGSSVTNGYSRKHVKKRSAHNVGKRSSIKNTSNAGVYRDNICPAYGIPDSKRHESFRFNASNPQLMKFTTVITNKAECDNQTAITVPDTGALLNVTTAHCCITHCVNEVTVNGPEEKNLYFRFVDFNVPGVSLLSADLVKLCNDSLAFLVEYPDISSGMRLKTQQIKFLCGYTLPEDVYVERSSVKLRFKFHEARSCVDKMSYAVEIYPCNKYTYLQTCRTFTDVFVEDFPRYIFSPGFDVNQNYPNNVSCEWRVKAAEGKVIQLDFSTLSLWSGDFITVHVSSTQSSFPEILSFPGFDTDNPIVLPSNQCVVKFVSDDVSSEQGFNITVSAVEPSNFVPMFSNQTFDCSQVPEIPKAFLCDLEQDCVHGEDERNCSYSQKWCRGGYVYGSSCYNIILNAGSLSWLKAEDMCKNQFSSHLVTINTVEEHVFLDRLREIHDKKLNFMFLGLQRMKQDVPQLYRRLWRWSDGKTAFYLPREYRFESWSVCTAWVNDVFHSIECGMSNEKTSVICERTQQLHEKHEYLHFKNIVLVETDFASAVKHKFDVFKCESGEFISLAQKCDSTRNCYDGSDENDCDYEVSRRKMFTCDSGGFVAYSFVCDEINDCLDGSDETFCKMLGKSALKLNTTLCTDGMPIDRSRWCDGWEDCLDASDEEDCTFCSGTSVLCPVVGCIPYIWNIDSEIDCPIRDRFGRRILEQDFRENVFETPSPPGIVYPDGYGKVKIEPLDKGVPCPSTHFQCSEGYCIPIYMLCNGFEDCPHAEDEVSHVCEEACIGMYKCKHSTVCVHFEHLCDSKYHCPLNDDETLCVYKKHKCPEGCTCERSELKCPSLPRTGTSLPLRYMDVSGADLTLLTTKHVVDLNLIFLNVSSCGLTGTSEEYFTFLNLRILDLSNNEIVSVSPRTFINCQNLVKLYLSNNKLFISNLTFLSYIPRLKYLDLSSNTMPVIAADAFKKATKIEELILRNMELTTIESHAFRGLTRLKTIDLTKNNILYFQSDIFESQTQLTLLKSDNFRLCCSEITPKSLRSDNCIAPTDEISSCDDILRSQFYRIFLWIMAALTITGNSGVLVYRLFFDKTPKRSFGIIITCLGASDLLMGAYLLIIGVADIVYQNRYLWVEEEWKSSFYCQLAGVLCVVSSEVSAFFILLLTVDRFLAIAFPLHGRNMTSRQAVISSVIIWLLGIAIATIPLLPPLRHWKLYSQNSVAAPLPITRVEYPGKDYAFAIFTVFNLVVFICVAIGQLLIYVSIRCQRPETISTLRVRQDMTIAKRLFLVVITDFLCWFPIGVLGLMARSDIPVPGYVNVLSTVFLLPLNSAINPFLYTVNSVLVRRKSKKRRRTGFTLKRRRSQNML